jgi:hypothetical protein
MITATACAPLSVGLYPTRGDLADWIGDQVDAERHCGRADRPAHDARVAAQLHHRHQQRGRVRLLECSGNGLVVLEDRFGRDQLLGHDGPPRSSVASFSPIGAMLSTCRRKQPLRLAPAAQRLYLLDPKDSVPLD